MSSIPIYCIQTNMVEFLRIQNRAYVSLMTGTFVCYIWYIAIIPMNSKLWQQVKIILWYVKDGLGLAFSSLQLRSGITITVNLSQAHSMTNKCNLPWSFGPVARSHKVILPQTMYPTDLTIRGGEFWPNLH